MKTAEEISKEIKEHQHSLILNTAMQGSYVSLLTRGNPEGVRRLLGKGHDDNDLSTAVETCNELERRVRVGQGLAEAIILMRQAGWATKITSDLAGNF